MESVGPLLLLLLMSYILISTVTISTSPNQSERENEFLKKLKENKKNLTSALRGGLKKAEDIKNVGQTCQTLIKNIGDLMKGLSDVSSDIFKVAQSMVNVVPVVGSVFSLIMTLVIVIDNHVNDKSVLKDIKEEFDKLDAKLDQYHMEQKWNIWAAGVYHKPELDIRLAWTEYKTLLGSLAGAKDDVEKKKHKQNFIEAYSKYEKAPREMGELLKKTGKSFINNLGDELAEHVKCHEKEILEYMFLILTLIIKGNMMNEYYYTLKDIESKARDDEMMNSVYEAMTAMFDIQKRCIANSMTYVLQDVKPLIDKSEKRDVLAKEVWSFLQETYDRYDWMVVAFITKNSNHKKLKHLNKHVLTGFHYVSTQRITVAVARQIKGNHSEAWKVSDAIKTCLNKSVPPCYEVAETLSKCTQKVKGIPVSKTYTAVHAYTDKANPHQSIEAQEANPRPKKPSNQTPYIYTGDCAVGGKFVVLIKSDKEMTKNYLCSEIDCGEQQDRGTCITIEDMFLAMCQCNYRYYGQYCENNIDDYYDEELKREAAKYRNIIIVKDSRVQNRK
ncbi:uncharacterized protein LOC120725657 [Simochromis diagramma]|uniref:uncharacterized protein LOC120725657 n=1 Tax=Simochromis diagramma TaxID=43689 RepID=UPI001A7F021D|nr:uncharacterized protein LOC120725657 [Simochromis diagramma]